jgi:hypothetical protein
MLVCQVSDAAWGARLADPQPWDDGTGLKDRVRHFLNVNHA